MRINKLDYVEKAERVIQSLLRENPRNGKKELKMTTSKIRNILSMVTQIYNDVIHSKEDKLDVEMQSRVQYLKMRTAYEAGRNSDVKEFVKQANILEILSEIGNSKENLSLFCNYMEALVAYHRFYGGND